MKDYGKEKPKGRRERRSQRPGCRSYAVALNMVLVLSSQSALAQSPQTVPQAAPNSVPNRVPNGVGARAVRPSQPAGTGAALNAAAATPKLRLPARPISSLGNTPHAGSMAPPSSDGAPDSLNLDSSISGEREYAPFSLPNRRIAQSSSGGRPIDDPVGDLNQTDAGKMNLPSDLTGPIDQPAGDSLATPRDMSPPSLQIASPTKKSDFDLIDTQAGEFRQRFLQAEAIELRLPMPDQMIPLGGKLPPIRLEASYTRPISLRDCVDYALSHNLSIRINDANADSNQWLFYGSLGRYLPDILMNYRQEYLQGGRLVSGVIPVTFKTPNVTTSATLNWGGFRGGAVTFGMLSQLHQYKAAKQQFFGSINDALLQTTIAYYEMVRNEALLEIQTRAVEVSQAQVNLNRQLENAGTGTKFQVLQSETQLARDQQNLLLQEVALRKAAINLATILNLNADVNLLSVENEVRKVRLIDQNVDITRLIGIAVANRPELKQFEHLRIAAKRNVQVAAAPLYPQLNFFLAGTGSGATLGRSIVYSQPSFQTVALAQPPVNAGIIRLGNGPTFAVDNSTLGFGGGGTGSKVAFPAGQVFVPPQAVNRQIRASIDVGFSVDWNFAALGTTNLTNIQSNRALARQALLQSNQQLMNTLQQVRNAYLTSQTAERQIEVATKEVISSAEALRLSRVRLANGVGTNIDVINAQRDFTTALVNKADAIITFDIAQAQLLHDIGLISRGTLTTGRLVR